MTWSRAFQAALFSIDGIGPATLSVCLEELEKAGLTEAEFWVNTYSIWGKIGLNEKTFKSIQKFKKEYTSSSYLEHLDQKNVRVVIPADAEFPSLLKQTERFPSVLFARGERLTGSEALLAVVGTRNITEYGRQVVGDFVPTLVHHGKTIVSGFMYGVDVEAQRAALQAGGKTVGVLGFGFDHMYPPEQGRLFHWFLAQGATFYSPFAPHVPAKKGNFPARNAVVAGMSEGVLVIEGAERSGSLITAHHAADLGREVWAVPGSIYSRFSVGTQKLINEGAQLVNSAEEILGFVSKHQARHLSAQRLVWKKLPKVKAQLCETLWNTTCTTDDLGKSLALPVTEVAVHLIELELLGLVKQVGNKWQLQ